MLVSLSNNYFSSFLLLTRNESFPSESKQTDGIAAVCVINSCLFLYLKRFRLVASWNGLKSFSLFFIGFITNKTTFFASIQYREKRKEWNLIKPKSTHKRKMCKKNIESHHYLLAFFPLFSSFICVPFFKHHRILWAVEFISTWWKRVNTTFFLFQ